MLVSLDDGRQYDVRVSPELVGGVCRFVWKVPNLPVSNARLRLRARIGGREVCGPEGTPFSIVETPLRPLERWTFRKGEWWVDEHGRPFDAPGLGSRDQGPSFRAGCPCPPADEPVRAPFDVVPASSRLLSASDATGAVPAVAPHPVPLSRSLPRRE